jgi:hypothetical protein
MEGTSAPLCSSSNRFLYLVKTCSVPALLIFERDLNLDEVPWIPGSYSIGRPIHDGERES